MNVYMPIDLMPSGHGHVSRGHVKHLLDKNNVELTVRSHQMGWNQNGQIIADRPYTDTRFRNDVITNGRINDDYLIKSEHDVRTRVDDLTDNLGTNQTARSHDCVIREFEGQEDIWHTIGGMEWVPQAPTSDETDTVTIMETDYNLNRVPDEWIEWAKEVTEVWVPNEWVYSAFEEAGYTDNIEVVPYGIDFSYKPTAYDCTSCGANKHTQPRGGGHCLDDDTFTIFSVMRWYHIKGVDILLEAFLREFSGSEDVRLFLKTTSNNNFELDGGGVHQAVQHLIQQLGLSNPPEVGIRTEMMSDQQLMDLYGLADGFAFPSRAECHGIAWTQAMHAGTPVMTTDWSAMNHYLSDDEAILIDDGETKHPESRVNWVPRKGGKWYPDDAEWFEPDMQAVQDGLRKLYELSDSERNKMTQNAQELVHNTLHWDDHIKTRIERYEHLLAAQ